MRSSGIVMWLNYLCILLIAFAVCVSRNEALNVIALYVAIPLSFLGSFFYNKNSFARNRYLKMILLLYLWMLFTIFTSQDVDGSLVHISPMLGCILLCFIVSNLAYNQKLLPWIYLVYILLLVEAMIYVQNNILSLSYDISSARADDDRINANTLAYYLFYATISLYVVGVIIVNKRLKRMFSLLFLVMIPLSFYIAIIAASRQVLIIQIPTLSILLWIRYFQNSKVVTKMISICIVIIAFLFFNESISNVYNNSYLSVRNENSYEEDVRVLLIKEAVNIGCEHPILGLGPGGFARQQADHLFSHCSYTELFANSGFPALAIYVYILIYFMRCQLKRYIRYKDKMYLIFFTFGVMYSIYQFFFVFVTDLWLISFFLLVSTHSEVYYLQNVQYDRAIGLKPKE